MNDYEYVPICNDCQDNIHYCRCFNKKINTYMIIYQYMGETYEREKNLTLAEAKNKQIKFGNEKNGPCNYFNCKILEMEGRDYILVKYARYSESDKFNLIQDLTLDEAIQKYAEYELYHKRKKEECEIKIFNIKDDDNIEIELNNKKANFQNKIIEREEKDLLDQLIKKHGIPEKYLERK